MSDETRNKVVEAGAALNVIVNAVKDVEPLAQKIAPASDIPPEAREAAGLPPCPFCGNAETLEVCSGVELEDESHPDQFTVVCDFVRGGCGASSRWEDSEDDAVKAWSARALDAQTKELARLRETLDTLRGDYFELGMTADKNLTRANREEEAHHKARARIATLEQQAREMGVAIVGCLDWAGSRRFEWGERADDAFAFLEKAESTARAATAATNEGGSEENCPICDGWRFIGSQKQGGLSLPCPECNPDGKRFAPDRHP